MHSELFLKLYVDPAWRREGLYSPLMFPFWGNPIQEASLHAKDLFDSYGFDTNYYSITNDVTRADMVFPPYRHAWLLRHDPGLLEECVQTAQQAKIPLLIDAVGDIEYVLPYRNAYMLRVGGYRFLPKKNTVIVPFAADDLLERCAGGVLQVRQKREGIPPVVGFAGWAQISPTQTFRTLAKELPTRLHGLFNDRYKACSKGVLWRKKAIQVLQNAESVTPHLLVRQSFSGSAKTAGTDMRSLRQEFVDLLLNSDYGLDVRGDANASTRLFEILSLGRIPIILDTERNLPFSDVVDYDTFSLRVDFRQLNALPDIVARFHERLSPERFKEMQQSARQAYRSYFRVDAQMPHIIRELRKLQSCPSRA